MQLDFPNGDYVSLRVVAPGTAGVAYDCRIGASMKCGDFFGEVEAYVDGGDVKGFIDDLTNLNATLRGNATLLSEDGGRSIALEVIPADQLGHFLVKVKLGKDLPIHPNHIFETGVVGIFAFEAQAMGHICEHLANGVTTQSDA